MWPSIAPALRPYPITIDNGELQIDDGRNLDCCTLSADGELDVFDFCRAELKHVLGERGLRELEQLAKTSRKQVSDPEH